MTLFFFLSFLIKGT